MSDILDSIYEMVKGLNKAGCLSDEKLEEVREICEPYEPTSTEILVINGIRLKVEKLGHRRFKADHGDFLEATALGYDVTSPIHGSAVYLYSITYEGEYDVDVVFKVH